jgi:CubicO group peptidase (beta-lactamase class C family)
MTNQVSEQLNALRTTIEHILKASGSAGASVGVIHDGESYDAHYGFKDHQREQAPDSNTLYGIGSLSKSMIASLIGHLVDTKVLSWNDNVRSIIPEVETLDCTILDLLSMRSGLPTFNILWYQGNSYPLVDKSSLISMINGMKPCFLPGKGWRYSNWGYALAAEIIKRKTTVEFHEKLGEILFKPLGMNRTRLDPGWREDSNIAEGFMGLNDATLLPIRSQTADSSTIMGPAGGVCSTTKDLLLYYGSLLTAMKHEINGEKTAPSPFKQLGTIFQGHVPMPQKINSINQYALGWVKGSLPGWPGALSPNGDLLDKPPIIGKGTDAQTFFSHTGSLAGFTSTAILLPESQIAVFVLVNTKGSCDSSDFIANAVLDKLLRGSGNYDFVQLTQSAMERASGRYKRQSEELSSARVSGTSSKPLSAYQGRYYWTSKSFYVDVFVQDGSLKIRIMDRSDQVYDLEHYHYDTFTWLMTDEEEARRSRYVQAVGAYKFVFEANEIQKIVGFKWMEMGGGPGFFTKL